MKFDPFESIKIDYYDPSDKVHGIALISTAYEEQSPLKQARLSFWHFSHNVYYKGCVVKRVTLVKLVDYSQDEILVKFNVLKLKRWVKKQEQSWIKNKKCPRPLRN